MLIDKKILSGGIALLVVGFVLTAIFGNISPVGREGMTDDEIAAFLIEEQENQDYTTLAGIMIGVGFLLILISFGARRKKKGGAKKTEKKPASYIPLLY